MELLITLFFVGLSSQFIGTLVGSGGLITFPAMLLLGVPVHSTISANKLSNAISSTTSLITLVKQRKIAVSDILKGGPIGLIAGVIGGLITTSIPEPLMKTIAIFLLVFVLVLSFVKPKEASRNSASKNPKGLMPIYFGIGVYNGAFGPGQGSLLMHFLSRKGIDYLKTIGLTRANTLASGLGAVVTYIFSGDMIWSVAFAITIGGIIGGQIAIFIAPKMSKKVVHHLMRVVVILLIIQLLGENLIRGILS